MDDGGMSAHATPPVQHEEQRAIAPIKWSKPNGGTVAALAIWVVGLVLSGVVPLLLLGSDPYEAAPGGRIAVGLTFTLVGALVMVFSPTCSTARAAASAPRSSPSCPASSWPRSASS